MRGGVGRLRERLNNVVNESVPLTEGDGYGGHGDGHGNGHAVGNGQPDQEPAAIPAGGSGEPPGAGATAQDAGDADQRPDP